MTALMLTVVEAAAALGISRTLAYEAVRTKQIPSLRIGRRILIPLAQLRLMAGESEDDPAATGSSSEPNIPFSEKGCGSAPD